MSHTTIIHVYPNDRIECGEELSNSWGSAPYIWDYMIKKYIDPEGNIMYTKTANALWKLWDRKDIPEYLRAVLMMTFDRAYVSKANYDRAAADIRSFLKEHNDTNVENHWHRIANIFENDPDVPAIGLWCTSVSRNPFDGSWNEDKEEYDPPKWDRVYEIYNSLDRDKSKVYLAE